MAIQSYESTEAEGGLIQIWFDVEMTDNPPSVHQVRYQNLWTKAVSFLFQNPGGVQNVTVSIPAGTAMTTQAVPQKRYTFAPDPSGGGGIGPQQFTFQFLGTG